MISIKIVDKLKLLPALILCISTLRQLSYIESMDVSAVDTVRKMILQIGPKERRYNRGGVVVWKIENEKPVPIPKEDFGNWSNTEVCYIVLQIDGKRLYNWCNKKYKQNTFLFLNDRLSIEYTMRLSLELKQQAEFNVEIKGHESPSFKFCFFQGDPLGELIVNVMFVMMMRADNIVHTIKQNVHPKWIAPDLCTVLRTGISVYLFCGPKLKTNHHLKQAAENLCNDAAREIGLECFKIEYQQLHSVHHLESFYNILGFKEPELNWVWNPLNMKPGLDLTWEPLRKHLSQIQHPEKRLSLKKPFRELTVIRRISYLESNSNQSIGTLTTYKTALVKGALPSDGCAILYSYVLSMNSVQYDNYRTYFLWIGRNMLTEDKVSKCAEAFKLKMILNEFGGADPLEAGVVFDEGNETVDFKHHFRDYY